MTETKFAARTPDLVHLSRKLENIGKIAKCEGCGCYVDTIKEFDAVLNRPDVQAPDEVRGRIGDLDANHQTTHGCIGCDPCYPVAVSNALYEVSGGESAEACGESCDCDTQPAPATSIVTIGKALEPATKKRTVSWPIEAGDYRLGNLSGAVAIATLASENLYEKFSQNTCAMDCAICGKVFTENIGIEKVVKNIISNRHIRFLILCGEEAKGHLTGACIKALHANGLDERQRILEAPGKRPWIKTLTPPQIARFQKQVQIVDLIGCDDIATIEAKVEELAALNPGSMVDDVIAEGVPHYVAEGPVKLQLDRAGFLIIHPKPEANWIFVEHYKNTGEPTCVVEGSDPARLCAELIELGLVSQLDHAAYLGRELERAKLSMQLGFAFAQDRALGELDPATIPEW
jgi:tetrahydromethanopterin S-methyltransferase subunit A